MPLHLLFTAFSRSLRTCFLLPHAMAEVSPCPPLGSSPQTPQFPQCPLGFPSPSLHAWDPSSWLKIQDKKSGGIKNLWLRRNCVCDCVCLCVCQRDCMSMSCGGYMVVHFCASLRGGMSVFARTCMCLCLCVSVHASPRGGGGGGGLPVHGQLPVERFGYGHPVKVPHVVGGVHTAKHQHAALLILAGMAKGEWEKGGVIAGGE